MVADATISSTHMLDSSKIMSVVNLETKFKTKVIHSQLNLEVLRGETLVLFGGSGSGKSTLLRALIGLEQPTSGAIYYGDCNLIDLSEREWKPIRQKIAYAFQGGALFDSLTVAENLLYPLNEHTKLSPKDAMERVREILEKMGLPGTEELLPASLSGGMQKRVGLARAIILDPEIILYDEPTAGLDPANSRKIAEAILLLKKSGKTSILVTHDTACALQVADRIAYIHEGKIAALQPIGEVKSNPHPLIDAYLNGEAIS